MGVQDNLRGFGVRKEQLILPKLYKDSNLELSKNKLILPNSKSVTKKEQPSNADLNLDINDYNQLASGLYLPNNIETKSAIELVDAASDKLQYGLNTQNHFFL